METLTIDQDIKVLYIQAASFPEGVLEAHQKLHALIPSLTDRKYFGISRPENSLIVYQAAAEEKEDGEAEKLNCPTLLLKQGNYLSLTIKDFMQDPSSIGRAFQTLLASPDLDLQGYCVEWYVNDQDVNCMIRLKE